MQRKATAAHRRRIRARGLVRVEVHVPQGDAPLLRQLAEHLRADSKVAELRNRLQEALGGNKPKTVLEMFASGLTDEVFDGVFDHERTISHRDVDL